MHQIIRKAFTLIELLVVIAIIGILSGLIIVSIGGMTDKATVAKAQVFSNSLRNSLILDLVSEWKLDGNLNDSWSGNNNGSGFGMTASTDCVQGSCYSFDGNGDYVSIPHKANQSITDAITMSVWIKTTANQPSQYPYVFSKHWVYVLRMLQNTNTVNFYCGGGNEASASLSLNKWNFIVGTFDKNGGSNNLKLYINGVLIDKETYSGSIGTTMNNIWLGVADNSWSTAGFIGLMDEVRLYDAAIPISRIKEQYYAGLNSLLANGNITNGEYSERLNSIASNE